MTPCRTIAALLAVALGATLPAGAADSLPINITPSANGMTITAGGDLFAEYNTDSAGRPVLWPVFGPTGFNMMRQWPIGDQAPYEAADHPHHRGMWFGYDQMNGIDFWHNPGPPGASRTRGRIVHREFTTPHGVGDTATLTTSNDWVGPQGEVVCHDQRTLRFGASKDRRWIDFLIRLLPGKAPLHIGDSKEGALAIRVAGPLKEDAKVGGRIVNAHGLTGKAAWGQRAAWVDYNGPLGDDTVGIAILSHPSNFRAKPRWHVRSYGLFAANPFGESDFPKLAHYKQGPITVNVGDELRLRYRVVLHVGDEEQAGVAAMYREYASQ